MPWLMYFGNTLSIRWKIMYFLNLKLFMKISTCLCEIFFCLFVFVCFSTWLPMCFTLVWDTFMQPCHSNQTQTTSISILGSLPQYISWSAWQLSHYQFLCKVFFFFWFSWWHTCHFSDQERVMKCCMESSYIGIDLSIRPSPRMQTSQWQSSISCMGSGTRTSLGFSAIEKHWKIRSSYQFYGVYASKNWKTMCLGYL